MKNQIINEIQRKMLPYLNNEQLLHLKAVLEVSFQGVTIEMVKNSQRLRNKIRQQRSLRQNG